MEEIKDTKVQKTETKVIRQLSKSKIVIRTLAVIMLIAGFFLTFKAPEILHGLSYTELGALANGYAIENVDAMFEFMEIKSEKDFDQYDLNNNKDKAQSAIKESIAYTCLYWFLTAVLLVAPIKDEETEIEVVVKEENK